MRKFLGILILISFLNLAFSGAAADPKYEWITYMGGKRSFPGLIFKPEGAGPFPAIIWNHGHAKNLMPSGGAPEYFDLARLFTRNGFVLFVPDRHMHDVTADDYTASMLDQIDLKRSEAEIKKRHYQQYLEVNASDVLDAVNWLRKQLYVDTERIVLSGWASGGIAGLMAAERDRHIRALVLFSPGCTQWKNEDLHGVFRRSLSNCAAPLFLIQASNDSSLQPSDIALPIMEQKGPANRLKIYAYAERSGTQKTSLAIAGWEKWSGDVLTYLDGVVKN